MKKVVIIGNSAAGISAAEAICEKDKDIGVTIISDENQLGYYRYRIGEVLSGKSKEIDILFKSKDFYDRLKIQVLQGQKVERVSPKRNQVILEDKTKISYDALIVASGLRAKMPKEIKGLNKDGVFEFRSLDDLKSITAITPFAPTVCIYAQGVAGLQVAYGLSKPEMDVKLIIPTSRLLPEAMEESAAQELADSLKERGVEIIWERSIVEVFGEGEVKALKLNTGKVIGCGLLIIDDFLTSQTRFLQDTDVKIVPAIVTDWCLKTTVPNIFAAGDVVQMQTPEGYPIRSSISWDNAAAQGKLAGENTVLYLQGKEDQMLRWQPPSECKSTPILSLS
ncbi:MAG: FAD-dependent oxidoreductase [PVC group bacterium]|nr:FAD-dependent oxidoreductase [PVC group bacterium]